MYWRKCWYLRWQVQEEMGLVFADKIEKKYIKSSISCLVEVTHRYIISFVKGIMCNQSTSLQGSNIDIHSEKWMRKDNRELLRSHVAESHFTITFEENFLFLLHHFLPLWIVSLNPYPLFLQKSPQESSVAH